jgi:FtsZ-binding cell division protein ZapB
MNEEFINTFIEIMNKKIEELTRTEIMLNTKLAIAQKAIDAFNSENASLKKENEKLSTSLNKKVGKAKEENF